MRRRIAIVKDEVSSRAGSFDAESFFAALDAQRRARRLTWKQVAFESGISASTLTRMAQGKRPDVDSLAALASWSGLTVDDFVMTKGVVRKAMPLAKLAAHLRSDPNLSPATAAALADILTAAYDRLKKLP